MFSNKTTQSNRPNRIDSNSNSKRSNTPQHYQTQIQQRPSQSQAKPQVQQNFVASVILPPISEQSEFEKPYYIGKGNNQELIKRILCRRKGWKEVSAN